MASLRNPLSLAYVLASVALPALVGPALAAQPASEGRDVAFSIESVREAPRRTGRPIPGRFIITLEPRADPRAVAAEVGVEPDFIYQRVLNGFAGRMSDFAQSKLRRDHRVVRIEQDREAVITQTANSWGVDRIDQAALPLDGYYRPPGTGGGVTVYVVDTGIRFDHLMFEGRAVSAIDVVGDGRDGNDCSGHGTHVAGTIGGGYGYGVAPGVNLASARVLNCEGTGPVSGIISALDWIAINARRPAVVNMSLGGTAVASLDDAVSRLVNSGIVTVVAAGNDAADACTISPGRAPSAITIAATDQSDTRASFSNFGSCVDMFAPGAAIVSAYHSTSRALARMSGTSMAAPHVAGAAAIVLQQDPSRTPSAVLQTLLANATANIVISAQSPSNHLLFSGQPTTAPQATEGDDRLVGTEGPDELRGLGGNDRLEGLGGNDVLDGGTGSDTLIGAAGADRLAGGSGADRLEGGGDDDTLYGAADNDLIYGATGADTFYAGAGDDVAYGGRDNDIIYGDRDNDTLYGDLGDDIVIGGAGTDTMSGGDGADTFRFQDGSTGIGAAADRIIDFTAALDKIDLSAMDADTGTVGDQAYTFIGSGTFNGRAGELRAHSSGGNTLVEGDTNGDGVADFTIVLGGSITLAATNFSM